MMRLNGWKRIGIVGSVVWILGAGVYTHSSEMDRSFARIGAAAAACDEHDIETVMTPDAREKAFHECEKIADDSLALALSNARFGAAVAALVPVPLGWGLIYLILFLVRWIQRGFMPPS